MHKRLLPALAAVTALAAPAAAAAAPGDLDLGFAAPHGFASPATGGAVNDLAVDPQGRAIASLERGDGPGRLRVARFAADGTPDAQFGAAGVAETDIDPALDSERGKAVALLPDGRIVVAGVYDKKLALARFDADGSLDETFNDANPNTPAGTVVDNIPSGTTGESIEALAVAPDGDVLAAGTISNAQNQRRLLVVRYLESGGRDATFDEGDPVTPVGLAVHDVPDGAETVEDVLVDPATGSVVVTGTFRPTGGVHQFLVVRLTALGHLDAGFGDAGAFTRALGEADAEDGAYAAVRRPDGRLVVAGGVDSSKETGDTALVGLTTGGELDPAFGEGGVRTVSLAPLDLAGDIALLPDGRLMVSGAAGSSSSGVEVLLARFAPDGTLDGGFGAGGSAIHSLTPGTEAGAHVAIAPDGGVLVGGGMDSDAGAKGFVARFEGGDPAPAAEPERPVPPAEPTVPAGTPGPPATPAAADVAPALSGVKVVRRGKALSLRLALSEAATVRIVVTRAVVKRGRTRFVRVGALTRRLAAGQRTVRVTGRLARALRRPGRYRFSITAADAAGHRSAAVRAALRTR